MEKLFCVSEVDSLVKILFRNKESITMIHQLSHKLRAQITQFSGKLSQGLNKPLRRFADEMIYGLTASQSLMLSEISRSLNESIPLLKTENRLCRNLGKKELCFHLQRALASSQSSHIKEETLLVLDISDISKKYAECMQYLAKVRDGSESKLAKGFGIGELGLISGSLFLRSTW